MRTAVALSAAALAVGALGVVGIGGSSAGTDTCKGSEWTSAAGTYWEGKRFDLVRGHRSRVVTAAACVSVGGTTYVTWPNRHGVGTS